MTETPWDDQGNGSYSKSCEFKCFQVKLYEENILIRVAAKSNTDLFKLGLLKSLENIIKSFVWFLN